MSEFVPCPFCKRTDGFQVKTVWKSYKFVACQCKAAGPVMRTEEEAIEAWNRRPLDECTFSLEYDREEMERRQRAQEEDPFGLFPQSMPSVAWTCSRCGTQYKAHYGPDEEGRPHVLPLPPWMQCCPSCGAKITDYIERSVEQ